MSSSQSHTTTELVLASATALAAGMAVGALMVQADTQAKLRRLQRRIASFLHLESVLERSPSPTSSYGEFASSVRASDLPPGTDLETARNTKLVLVVLRESLEDPQAILCQSARTVLGQFKKYFRRKDPNLRLWEAGGHRMEVKVAQSQEVLTDVQLMARAAGVPTHTYAGKGPGHGKHRSVIAVGPAEKATLHRIVGRLEEM